MSHESAAMVADMALRSAPPVVVSSLSVFGVSLPVLVQIGTLIYLGIMISYTLTKWFKGR
ncbi:holin [Marinomonas phage CB5A]|uniref:Holin n=3 Tax=Murciavirus TaxID=2731675 RepID=A0A1W5SC53_9CAUD|nr:holin [Marinomonas phage CPP1m]YP_009791134.1 holin [Marinomonas phage CB5A]ARB11260.1 hypothetical protein [Marinomonas phage CPP1m]ARB11310.1 hypothetical protein [Marinomonas phage CPG1g]ASP46276.1 hypothetical protein [Marinomonas phage CB5A]